MDRDDACSLPCSGCDEAVAAACAAGRGNDLMQSADDGCWVVRIGHAERLRCDSPCLACSYFRNKAEQLAQ